MLPARNYVLPLSNGRPRISFFDISFFSQLLFLLSPPSSTPTHTHFSSTQWWETASENPSSVLMLLLPIFLVSAFFFLFFFCSLWTNSYVLGLSCWCFFLVLSVFVWMMGRFWLTKNWAIWTYWGGFMVKN